ncbi:MAG: sulfite exporter TauE/SafE family protein [Dehalococcoidia bacterium]
MLSPETLVLALIIILIAGVTQSLTGFGFGVVAVPLLALVMSPKIAPPLVMILAVGLNVMVLRRAHVAVEPGRFWMLALFGAIGTPCGVWVLKHWDADLLRVYIGIASVVVAAIMALGLRLTFRREQIASAPFGFVSGLMGGSINMYGPAVMLFFNNQGVAGRSFRANLIAYFLFQQMVALPILALSGILTREVWTAALVLMPALLLGTWAGITFADRVTDTLVRRVTLGTVALGGVLSLLKGLGLF